MFKLYFSKVHNFNNIKYLCLLEFLKTTKIITSNLVFTISYMIDFMVRSYKNLKIIIKTGAIIVQPSKYSLNAIKKNIYLQW